MGYKRKDLEEYVYKLLKNLPKLSISFQNLIVYNNNLIQLLKEAETNPDKSKNIEGLVEAISMLHKNFPLLEAVTKPIEELTEKDLLIIYMNLDPNARDYLKSTEDYFSDLEKYLRGSADYLFT